MVGIEFGIMDVVRFDIRVGIRFGVLHSNDVARTGEHPRQTVSSYLEPNLSACLIQERSTITRVERGTVECSRTHTALEPACPLPDQHLFG